jgi:ATP-dependent 26S proteasome regulatory subunit
LIASLRAAVAAAPNDVVLRSHLAEQLLAADDPAGAVSEAAAALRLDPTNATARDLMTRALAGPAPSEPPGPASTASGQPGSGSTVFGQPGPASTAPGQPTSGVAASDQQGSGPPPDFDWAAADEQFSGVVPPMFADGDAEVNSEPAYDVERPGVRLADVGGMSEVKARLEAAFLAPMRNPELSRLYGKSLKGGLLLYGPPGCGKTFLAKAVAGELGARFYGVTLADVLDMYIGQSEHNLREIFEVARRNAPCVLFLDELDALGQKRSLVRGSAMRGTVNQLLTELDGADRTNDGVFVLAATNHPWDVDAALRRPGRLDRTLLVLPPDGPAREAIFRYHLRDRPVERIDVTRLARRTEGYSGADLAHVCDTAAEAALLDSARSGTVRMIGMSDLETALAEVKPSIGAWLETARNVAMFANESGDYDDLLAYLKKRRLA